MEYEVVCAICTCSNMARTNHNIGENINYNFSKK